MKFSDQLAGVVDSACHSLANLPIDSLQYPFMQRAVVALILLAPLCAVVGLQVVNFRLAFFADAVGHSAFTGMGLGLALVALMPALAFESSDAFLLSRVTMVAFGLLTATAVTLLRRTSRLSSDTIVGVFSSSAVALGLILFSYRRISGGDRAFLDFLRGSVLSVTSIDLAVLFGFFLAALAFIAWSYNRLLLIGLNSDLAAVLQVRVARYEYAFAGFLSLLVMFCIPIVGALVVTALLVIPAAAARNIAGNAGSVFWWGVVIAWSSSVGGLFLADQFETPVGATLVLCNAAWFAGSSLFSAWRR